MYISTRMYVVITDEDIQILMSGVQAQVCNVINIKDQRKRVNRSQC